MGGRAYLGPCPKLIKERAIDPLVSQKAQHQCTHCAKAGKPAFLQQQRHVHPKGREATHLAPGTRRLAPMWTASPFPPMIGTSAFVLLLAPSCCSRPPRSTHRGGSLPECLTLGRKVPSTAAKYCSPALAKGWAVKHAPERGEQQAKRQGQISIIHDVPLLTASECPFQHSMDSHTLCSFPHTYHRHTRWHARARNKEELPPSV